MAGYSKLSAALLLAMAGFAAPSAFASQSATVSVLRSGTALDGFGAPSVPSSGVEVAQAGPTPEELLKRKQEEQKNHQEQKRPPEPPRPEPQQHHEAPAHAPEPPRAEEHKPAPPPAPPRAPEPPRPQAPQHHEQPAAMPPKAPEPPKAEERKPAAQPHMDMKAPPAAPPAEHKPQAQEPRPEPPKAEEHKPAQPAPQPPRAEPPRPEPGKAAPEPQKPVPGKAEGRPAPAEPPHAQPGEPKPAPQQPGNIRPAAPPPGAPALQRDQTRPDQRKPDGRPAEQGRPPLPPQPAPPQPAPVPPVNNRAPSAPAPAPGNGQPPAVPAPPGPGDAAHGNNRPTLLPPLDATRRQPPPAPGGKPGPQPNPQAVDQIMRPPLPPQQQNFTPQELQRLKALADKPQQTDQTIILPVENGAPVLDSDKDAHWRRGMSDDELRRLRRQAYGQGAYQVPSSDQAAQRDFWQDMPRRDMVIVPIDRDHGRRIDQPPQFDYPRDVRVERSFDDDRRVMDYGGQIVIRGDDTQRFAQFGRPPIYEEVGNGRVRTTVIMDNGDRIVTLRNRYGQLIQRSRIDRQGREYVLFFSPDLFYANDSQPVTYRDPGAELPPMRLMVPLNQYIVDVSSQENVNYYNFLDEPPVEPVERVYTIDEVRNSARIRDKMRRIDLDTITFATGSWDISMNQAGTLKRVADAINRILHDDPSETFMIEGHTDAVGSPESNLVLSDRRAEAVANVLTQVYGIPPENMVTQGYGEQFLKVLTYGPSQENRRVTIRRITPLVRPLETSEQQ
ncbi:OmpA family protein [Allorhizobium sp. BGMRC 0089]|uniref:OmpA family protein n=1 Tax=Allorhizobium sonneratiae TaxID=2934936 RepID=UPI0020332548|nr:OmpA family protein [Allorhizobium sonneratiae]MCM2292920.1 OmpA family protein [Allorhizobium sonneratiae]